jgi:hypothetical protein
LGEVQGDKTQVLVDNAEEDEEHDETPLLRDSDIPTLKEVLEQADVVLQVLDARDPLPFRSKWIEDSVKTDSKKRLAFVLNKIGKVLFTASSIFLTQDFSFRSDSQGICSPVENLSEDGSGYDSLPRLLSGLGLKRSVY